MNSPSQELNELVTSVAKDAGFDKLDLALFQCDLAQLRKFAQLLLQREGEALEVSCPHCDGSGSVEFYESVNPATRATTVDCQSCKGNGYTIEAVAQQPIAPGGEVDNQCSYRLEASLEYLERILSKIGVIDPGATNGDGPLLFLAAEIYLGEPQ